MTLHQMSFRKYIVSVASVFDLRRLLLNMLFVLRKLLRNGYTNDGDGDDDGDEYVCAAHM